MTQAEEEALYMLSRHHGISAREALTERPSWEITMLLKGLSREFSADG